MADEYLVDHRSTLEHFEYVLSLGKNIHGSPIDVDHFDDDGAKTKQDLFEETRVQDTVLKFNPKTGRLERYADSVWINIYELRRHLAWREIARSYYPSGKFISKERESTVTETVKPRELLIGCALRCLNWEEMRKEWERIGYFPTADDLTPSLREKKTDVHESSVYPGIVSIVTIRELYDLYLDFRRPDKTLGSEIIITKDTDGRGEASSRYVKCYIKAFPEKRPGAT